ncbi:YceI family protein [Terribacillus saccharophilus]|uniref:YceI family protein n=1 Tax=Terribacillus saccharophilus TaxID=361277 RepID=UPI0039827F66
MAVLKLDKAHSSISFTVKHMMVSKAKGKFEDFDVQFSGDLNDLDNSSVTATIQAATINTGNADRDGHLQSGDFFDAANHPVMTFKSKSVKKVSDDEFEITGDFTIKDVTNEETFKVEYNGTSKNPMDGSTIAGFEVEGKINREAYGLTYNAALETGGVLIGKDVKFTADFEFVVE